MTHAELGIRVARPDDANFAAAFAAKKRAEYESYSPIFWRRAADAHEKHQPFLRFCIETDAFASFTAESGDEVVGVLLANRHGAPPPFRDDPDSTWFVDDFFVAQPELWEHVGGALLASVADAARANGVERVIVVGAQRDEPKRAFLLRAGYAPTAEWWVHPVTPTSVPVRELPGIEAIVTAAPPVYDPGGPVALAMSLGDAGASQVARFTQWAAASYAVLAIVPARTSETSLREALAAQGYTVASEWYVRHL